MVFYLSQLVEWTLQLNQVSKSTSQSKRSHVQVTFVLFHEDLEGNLIHVDKTWQLEDNSSWLKAEAMMVFSWHWHPSRARPSFFLSRCPGCELICSSLIKASNIQLYQNAIKYDHQISLTYVSQSYTAIDPWLIYTSIWSYSSCLQRIVAECLLTYFKLISYYEEFWIANKNSIKFKFNHS